MSEMNFTCPACQSEFMADTSVIGAQIQCPHCSHVGTVPEHRACPFCGEQILTVAIKCKHCGEFLDGRDSGQPAQAAQPSNVVVQQMAEGLFLQTMNVGCAVVIFVVLCLFVIILVYLSD